MGHPIPWRSIIESMTTVEILYSYTTQPTENAVFALANAKDVYGIRKVCFDRAAKTLRVEYDATRLTAAAVTKLVRTSGLEIAGELPLIAPPPEPTPAPATSELRPAAGQDSLVDGRVPGGQLRCAAPGSLLLCVRSSLQRLPSSAPVAQLDRATDYESVGREFESLRAHHTTNKSQYFTGLVRGFARVHIPL